MNNPKHSFRRPVVLLLAAVGLALALLFSGAAAGPAAPSLPGAPAAQDITITPSVQISFPLSLTFSVKAAGDANITRLRVHYTVNRQNLAPVASEGWAQFTPATTVNAQWPWDMRK